MVWCFQEEYFHKLHDIFAKLPRLSEFNQQTGVCQDGGEGPNCSSKDESAEIGSSVGRGTAEDIKMPKRKEWLRLSTAEYKDYIENCKKGRVSYIG